LRLGMVATQPGPPFRNIGDQQLRKIHSLTVSPLCRTVTLSRRSQLARRRCFRC
jgi:hypothetical protein